MFGKIKKYWLYLLAGVLAIGLAMLAKGGKLERPVPTPTATAASPAVSELDQLKLADPLPMTGYSRAKFPHWIQQGNNCDTREVVLKRDGAGVATDSDCHPTRGTWTSPYDNAKITEPDQVQIDHVVPLANAWRSGAANWTTGQRQQFANDLTDPQLVAVSTRINESKGDQDPSEWKPPNSDYWCQYARNWVAVKYRWQLTVTGTEKSALLDMLRHC